MKNKKAISRVIAAVIVFAGVIILLYSFNRPAATFASTTQQRMSNPINLSSLDSGIQLLQTGDLVLRTGADITSYMFTQMNQRNKTYSHCGIVIVENGYPFIYHSIGGEDNPNQILKRDSARSWFSPVHNLGFGIVRYSIDSLRKAALVETTYKFFREKRMFDMDFDLNTDERLYCTEFVYKVISQVVQHDNFIKPSRRLGYTFVGVDDLFLNAKARFICQVRFK